jgi:hypothetical protein
LNLITDDRQRECVIAYFMYPDTREKIKEKYNIKNTTIKYHAEQGIKRIQLKLTANSC